MTEIRGRLSCPLWSYSFHIYQLLALGWGVICFGGDFFCFFSYVLCKKGAVILRLLFLDLILANVVILYLL